MKIDFWHFKHTGLYQLSRWQSAGLAKAFQHLGVHVRHMDEEGHTIRDELQRLWSDPPDWTLSLEYAPLRGYGLRELSIPHLHLLWQEPYALLKRSGYGQFFGLPGSHLVKEEDSFFLPPAVPEESFRDIRERTGSVFFGSYRDDEGVIENLGIDFSPFIIQKILEASEKCLEGLIPEAAFQVDPASPHLIGVPLKAVYFVIDYIAKSQAVKKMLSSLAKEKISLYGSSMFPPYYLKECRGSWKEWAKKHPSFSVHGPLPSYEIAHVISSYKRVLDPTPSYLGISLRLLQGLAAGCEVWTCPNPLVEHFFGRGQGVHYLGEEEREQDVAKGQEIVFQYFRCQKRAEEILHALH